MALLVASCNKIDKPNGQDTPGKDDPGKVDPQTPDQPDQPDKPDQPDPPGDPRVITLSFDTESTRASLLGDTPMWEVGDVIKLCNNNSANAQNVEITSSMLSNNVVTLTTTLTGTLYAVYPASAAKFSGKQGSFKVGFVIPSTTEGGSFANAHISVAMMDQSATVMKFRNVVSIMKFSNVESAIKKISITNSNSGSDLCGTYTVSCSWNSGNQAINISGFTQSASGGKKVTVTGLTSGHPVYIAVAPNANINSGAKFEYFDSNSSTTSNGGKTQSSNNTTARNYIYDLGAARSDASLLEYHIDPVSSTSFSISAGQTVAFAFRSFVGYTDNKGAYKKAMPWEAWLYIEGNPSYGWRKLVSPYNPGNTDKSDPYSWRASMIEGPGAGYDGASETVSLTLNSTKDDVYHVRIQSKDNSDIFTEFVVAQKITGAIVDVYELWSNNAGSNDVIVTSSQLGSNGAKAKAGDIVRVYTAVTESWATATGLSIRYHTPNWSGGNGSSSCCGEGYADITLEEVHINNGLEMNLDSGGKITYVELRR